MNHATDTFDSIVIGGGIVGLSAADALQRRGQRVLLLERFAPGNERGSSHGDGRIIRVAYPQAYYVELAQFAYAAWARLQQRAGRTLMQQTGGLDIGHRDSDDLADVATNFSHFALLFETLSAPQVARRFPPFKLQPDEIALYQPASGVLFATLTLAALWTLLGDGGATLLPHRAVVRIEPQRYGVTVTDDQGDCWRVDHLVVAAGAWTNSLLGPLGVPLPLTVTQEQVAYFRAPATPDHTMHGMPIFIHYDKDRVFYGLPRIEIDGVKVAGHHIGHPRHPDQPLPLDEANRRSVMRFVASRLPHLAPVPHHELSCLYTSTPDHDFILDRHPIYPQITLGAGFSGHGFKFGPMIGELLADLALGDAPSISLAPFALTRFAQADPK